jgi:hypothetical protein
MHQLEPFRENFGDDRIFVSSAARLLADRTTMMRDVFGFLGADPSFSSPQFERRWETSEGKGLGFSLAYRAAGKIKRPESPLLPRYLRWPVQLALRARVLNPKRAAPVMSRETTNELLELLADDMRAFRSWSGLPTDQLWSDASLKRLAAAS